MNRLRHPSLLICILALTMLMMSASRAQNVARHERLEIVRDGRVVVELNSDQNGGLIRLFNTRGTEMLVVRTDTDGGAFLRINSQDGTPSMDVQTKDQSLRITNRSQGRDQLIFKSGDVIESNEGESNTIKLLASRIVDVDNDLKDLQQEHQRLIDNVRRLRPGQSPEVTLDRMQRDIDNLLREQRTNDQFLRDLRNSEGRHQREVDDLRRRVQRLENRRPVPES